MSKFLDARSLTGAAVGIVVAVAAAFLFGLFTSDKKDTTIVLRAPDGQPCRAENPLSLRSKHKKKLTWHIDNQCTAAQFVELRNFAERTSAGAGPPETGVFPGDLVTRPEAFPPGRTDKGLEATPTKTVDRDATYKYEIWIGTARPTSKSLDPDIEWWK